MDYFRSVQEYNRGQRVYIFNSIHLKSSGTTLSHAVHYYEKETGASCEIETCKATLTDDQIDRQLIRISGRIPRACITIANIIMVQ